MWSALPKTQGALRIVLQPMLCDDTPTAATVALTTGVVTKLQKYSFLFPHSPLQYVAVAILHMPLPLRWQQRKYHHMGCSIMSERTSEFLVALFT
jgi:hypothetical protein